MSSYFFVQVLKEMKSETSQKILRPRPNLKTLLFSTPTYSTIHNTGMYFVPLYTLKLRGEEGYKGVTVLLLKTAVFYIILSEFK